MDHVDRLDYSPYLSKQVEGVSMLYEEEGKECILVATPSVGYTGSSRFSCLIFLKFSLLIERNLHQHQQQNNQPNIENPMGKMYINISIPMMDISNLLYSFISLKHFLSPSML